MGEETTYSEKSCSFFPMGGLLGDFQFSLHSFDNVEAVLEKIKSENFLNENQKLHYVCSELLNLIRTSKKTFLLREVLDYIHRVNVSKIVDSFCFLQFELWLNQFSKLSHGENYLIRGKIAGKLIPRNEYQTYFPIGMNKFYFGTHFVTAHASPDMDSLIASFWGWMDAFAARVSNGLHVWNVPGGEPSFQVEIPLLFHQIFGNYIFKYLAEDRTALSISGIDLVTQEGTARKSIHEPFFNFDYETIQKSVLLLDEAGFYLDDWHNFDEESVRKVTVLLNGSLRWFESNLNQKLISFFGREKPESSDVDKFIKEGFGVKIAESDSVKYLNPTQTKHLDTYLKLILKISKGLEATFEEFFLDLEATPVKGFSRVLKLIEELKSSELFADNGVLLEKRVVIFQFLLKLITELDEAIRRLRMYVERLDIALRIKKEVLEYPSKVISYRADLEEIKSKMGDNRYLAVTKTDKNGKQLPLGVIYASDLRRPILGTVSIRDFCNKEETKIPSYLDVISVVDHHKSHLSNNTPATAYISDVQSSNVLLAEMALNINDKYGNGGSELKIVEQQIDKIRGELLTHSNKRILKRLWQKHLVLEKGDNFFIDSEREFIEYLHYIYAIIDDTDLLTKVSLRDVECIKDVLNRMKSIVVGHEVEIINFDDIPIDSCFVDRATKRILQNVDTYSLYRKVYVSREKTVELNIQACAENGDLTIFADTKEQNGCCRVGQTKMFATNFATYHKFDRIIQGIWCKNAEAIYKENKDMDLHIHMITTVANAEDQFSDSKVNYGHKDEIWIWAPNSIQAIEHFKTFLQAFGSSLNPKRDDIELEFKGDMAEELNQIFVESFRSIEKKKSTVDHRTKTSMAILRFNAGTINSRKSMISPYLPRLVT